MSEQKLVQFKVTQRLTYHDFTIIRLYYRRRGFENVIFFWSNDPCPHVQKCAAKSLTGSRLPEICNRCKANRSPGHKLDPYCREPIPSQIAEYWRLLQLEIDAEREA